MGFYDISKNIDEYIDMCKSYDGSHIYQEFQKFVKDGISILELGSGPGFDIPFLNKHYRVTGSDLSEEFLNRLKRKYRDVPFLKLDAKTVTTKSTFDCIYSNKVLHHLTREELLLSLSNQIKILASDGIIAHSFWIGDEDQKMEGLLFTYYKKNEILDIISTRFKVLSFMTYQEFEDSDSIFIVAQLK